MSSKSAVVGGFSRFLFCPLGNDERKCVGSELGTNVYMEGSLFSVN